MKKILCFTLILLIPHPLTEPLRRQFIVWNVGQGAWSTLAEPGGCWHIDMGGSQFLFGRALKQRCGKIQNYLLLTHFDSDHMDLISRARFHLPQLCLVTPWPRSLSPRKIKKLQSLPTCTLPPSSQVQRLWTAAFKKRNDSHMYLIADHILITGDAPAPLERRLLTNKAIDSVTHYLAGHHGSRTSSSSALLQRLPRLHTVIVSAEKSRYGHPHQETLGRFRRRHVSVLLTEAQGSLFFDLN